MKWLLAPLPQGKYWDGVTLYTEPLGGSEAAVAYLARELARKGEEVTVVGHMTPGVENHIVDDVDYVTQDSLPILQTKKWDVVISSRWVEFLNNIKWDTECRIIWLHDMPYAGLEDTPVRHAVFLTKFQRDAWGVPPEQTQIIGNGIDHSLFTQNGGERDANKLIWSSNPDRGLAIAAKIFQDIRVRWPDLELHVFGRSAVYGWSAAVESPYLPRPQHMDNVFLHDPVKKAVLAKELQSAWALFYPTYWPETYCIATLEAQAAGTPVITSPLGALNETVKGGVLSYDYLNSVSQLRNKARWDKLSKAGLEFAATQTWEKQAQIWIDLAYNTIKEVGDAKIRDAAAAANAVPNTAAPASTS